jgi:proteasome assembly chaperone (PAC2) family protein
VVTLGGIGLQKVPENPQVYCTGNTKKIIEKYKSQTINCNIYGVVGPIMGVSGLLVGLAKYRDIPSVAILAETFGHPTYVGIKGAGAILNALNKKLELGLNLEPLHKDIRDVDKEIRAKTEQQKQLIKKSGKKPDTNYIG